MATLTPPKTKQKVRVTPRLKSMVRFVVFPFLLSRVRDELDRLYERVTRDWPNLWKGNDTAWPWNVDVREENKETAISSFRKTPTSYAFM